MEREVQRITSRPDFTARHGAFARCEFEPHAHSMYTVTLVLSGRLAATVGPDECSASEGTIILTDVNEVHSGAAEDVEFISISIRPGHIVELAAEMGLTGKQTDISFRRRVVSDQFIAAGARHIADELAAERVGWEAMLDGVVRQLSVHLLRSHLTVRKSAAIELSRAGPVDRRLRRAIEFIHNNYSRDLALEEIASAAYLSEFHFARLFKQITGMTPHVYVANLRLERARKLLTETVLPISEIAALVGYQSQSHFTKIFKSTTGLTPRAFREGCIRIQ